MSQAPVFTKPVKKRPKPVGPKLQKLLWVVFGLFALLVVNSVYLVSVTVAGPAYQNWFYLIMFMAHLGLGLTIVVPVIVFGIVHIRNTRHRRNKRAIKAGYALFIAALLIFISGFILTRVDMFGIRFEVNHPLVRNMAYWMHVVVPLFAIWLFVLHRLAGKAINWRLGFAWAGVAAGFAGVMLYLQTQDPRAWNMEGPVSGEQYFFPSLARTSTGNFIPAKVLANDQYCLECHADIHESWSNSVHKFSSFNNPPYLFSVKETRKAMMARDGNVQGSRFCAGCHDPVPFFSGAFDNPKFDDPDFDLSSDVTAQAGITCTVCHSISHINSPRGNSDYTITEPVHYPFAFSDEPALQWINRQLIKAKPAFHKATFLKPLHKTTEFCGTCHKVHLPKELNDYKWLRGQNHQDPFLLSGVSGQGITSFYYPPKAEANCNKCHMPQMAASNGVNFGSTLGEDGVYRVSDHMFPSANTAIPHMLRDKFKDADAVIAKHEAFNEGVMRVDIFGIREGGRIDSELTAPLGPDVPTLRAGQTYLLETVIRTLKMGHIFTQGTADSNQVWLDVTVYDGDRVVGRSGGMRPKNKAVDPWSHFVNAFVIDRDGNRIDRRNAEDIFVPLYNNQIPPGAGEVVHYRLQVPERTQGPLRVEVALRYRKFDTTYLQHITGNPEVVNDLPIMTMAEDSIVFPVGESAPLVANDLEEDFPLWQRWNDYGIGLLRKGQLGELGNAKTAFEQVEHLGRPEGPLNLARVYLKEGLIQTHAPAALARANEMGAYQWSLLWFGAEVASRNGDFDKAIENLREILRGGFQQAEGRGFDFSKDWRLRTTLGNALYQRGLQERGSAREAFMREAKAEFEAALQMDPEYLAAHWGMKQVYRDLGMAEAEAKHAALHAKYKPDDNARDSAVAKARQKYPAANHAAEDIVIYDLQRDGAFELPKPVLGGSQ